MLIRSLVIAVSLVMSVSVAEAAGEPIEGERLVSRWCTSCHAAGQVGADAAPALESVARDPARTDDYLFLWLSDPHPPMPQLQLSRREIGDIIAYLRTLQTPTGGR